MNTQEGGEKVRRGLPAWMIREFEDARRQNASVPWWLRPKRAEESVDAH